MGKDFFDVKENPPITFHSTKVVQIDPTTVEFDGDFAIRGASKPEKTDVYRYRQGDRCRHNRRDNGIRPKGIWDE
jgi:polyisoprenoid-binding protein YceI